MSKKSLPKPKSRSNLDKLKNDDYQPIQTKEHPELDLKFVLDKKVRKGLKPLESADAAPELTQAFLMRQTCMTVCNSRKLANLVSKS